VTQEFHISVTPVGQNDYLVRTEQVAPGVPLAEELVNWPVTEWLAAAGHVMNDPLQLVLQGDAIARNSVNLVALGQQLYNALFQGTLRDSWITAQGIAQNQQQVLRLRLGLKDTRLARLPWEVMHAGDRPIATGPYIAFSRYQSGIPSTSRLPTRNLPTPQEEESIKVLMVISSPTDQVRLELLKQEANNLQAEIKRQNPRTVENGTYLPEIELTVLDQPGREELTQALEQGRYHILHYSGHSNVSANGGEIYLVSRRTGLTETLSGDDLAGLLVNNKIQMAVFNSCLGAYRAKTDSSGDTGERNLTESLVKRGISSVLAMSERIPDEVALTLTQLFYRNLSQGYPLDLSVSRVRQGLVSAYGSHQMYWALPMLYLHREFEGFLRPQLGLSASSQFLNDYKPLVGTSSNAMYGATIDELEIPLTLEEMMSSELTREPSELDWPEDDTWGDLMDEIDYNQPEYDQDSAMVADLFRQLGNKQAPTTETPMSELESPVTENHHQEEQPAKEEEEEIDFWGDRTTATQPYEANVDSNAVNYQQIPLPKVSKVRRRRRLWPIFAIVGVSVVVAIIGLNWWNDRKSVVTKIPPIPTQTQPQTSLSNFRATTDLKSSSTGSVTAKATAELSQGNLQAGLEAVEELLNRGAFASADTALALVITKQSEDPSVNFVRGRLAWQIAQTRDKKYSIDDARRYWEIAVRDRPDSVLYNNAVGFAYYAEGNLNRANDAWFKAVNLALKDQSTTLIATPDTTSIIPSDALTAYAGLALGLYKSANSQTAPKKAQYLKEAIKLRQLVIQNEPVKFTVDKLAQNWLWTDQAIADWRSLIQEQEKM
jgi:tetratricopeptide (TPR) repeat protein